MSKRKRDRLWLRVGGRSIPIEVIDPNPDDHGDAVWVSMREPDPGYFPDNLHGACSECGAAIYYRPHKPAWMRAVCISCVATLPRD